MNEELLKQLAGAYGQQHELIGALLEKEGLHTKAPAAAMSFAGIFQQGGVFSVPGTDRDVFTAHIRPTGISNVLPLIPGNEDNPRYATLTGFTATTGARPTDPCDDSPQGFMKGCYLTARFGRDSQDTQTIEFDQLKRKANRGVFDDLILHGRVLGMTDLTPSGMDEGQMLNIITMSEMIGAAVQMERDLVSQMWQGSVANNTAGGGYKEFPGLGVQIATGQVDAETNQACPSLDSDVKEFNYNDVCGTSPSIVEYLSMLEWYLRHNARRMGFEPATWVIAMRPELWEELTACWPCQYNTNRCANAIIGTGSRTVIDGGEMVAARDAMRAGMYIDINGRRYQVVEDDGIFEHNSTNNANVAAGSFASSIYMVPVTVSNGFPVTYRQHVDYRLGGDDVNLLHGLQDFWTDRGVYSWAIENQKWCYKLSLKTEQRVVLRTPQLAGRIDHVLYSPLQHLRQYDPDDPYHADGGVSIRTTSQSYAVWL